MASYRHDKPSISPHSSPGEAESIRGTPDTSLTAFSPEDLRRGSNVSSTAAVASMSSRDDPFITNLSSVAGRKTTLSAQASTFQPAPSASSGHVSLVSVDTTRSDNSTPSSSHQGHFTTDTGASRCMRVCAIYDDADVPGKVRGTMKSLEEDGIISVAQQRIDAHGNKVYVRLSNIKESNAFYTTIRMEHQALAVEYLNPADWALVVGSSNNYSAHEGQVVLTALYPPNVSHDKKAFEQHLRQLLGVSGELVAWQKIAATEAGTFKMIAEFFDANDATEAVERCDGRVLPVGKPVVNVYSPLKVGTDPAITISVSLHQPDITTAQLARPTGHRTPTRGSTQAYDLSEAFGGVSLGAVPPPYMGPLMGRTSAYSAPPMGGIPFPQYGMGMGMGMGMGHHQGYYHPQREVIPYGHPQGYEMVPRGYGFDRSNGRRQNAVKVPGRPRNNNSAASSHNFVDVDKIHEGADVRTTVMLRNIPNKLSQAQLKDIVDESSGCKYDFMYLRIDFSNDCNVGYAFINFTDPLDIIDFVHARSGQKWYKSDKVAEVSYATIQGKDCLVQKFRNSSVMLEPPHYRPKLYFTIHDGEFIGEEERFPDSDNASKLKRSCENAEHVGLFAPSAGNGVREEQRRRGNFDRGTSLAQREEYDYGGRPYGRQYGAGSYSGGPSGTNEYLASQYPASQYSAGQYTGVPPGSGPFGSCE